VVASGLAPLEAVMVRTPGMAALFGWPEPFPEASGFEEQWARTESATDRTVARGLAALSAPERSQLVELLLAARESAG
ncbi:MAG: SCO6745 family protein, partial [Acidimicrobiales bacterium]